MESAVSSRPPKITRLDKHTHKAEIDAHFASCLEEIKEKKREQYRKYNKTRYEKLKAENPKEPRVLLSEEEKEAHRKAVQRQNYERRKQKQKKAAETIAEQKSATELEIDYLI